MSYCLIIGASPKPQRFSHKAFLKLNQHGINTVLFANRNFNLNGHNTITTLDSINADTPIDTVAMYIGPDKQPDLMPHIAALKPKRVIFNPGTESTASETLLKQHGIRFHHDCILRMLDGQRY